MRELALFAGAGGGILGGLLLGWRTVCAVEIDAYCRSVLLARQRDGILEPFPIWDDVRTFDGKPWRGHVDVISGGFPCQDISVAGKGGGLDGKRSGLWVEMARIVREVRPRFAFVENSPNLTCRGLGRVLGDLAEMGFDAKWGVFSACSVGLSHTRERLFIVANSHAVNGKARLGDVKDWASTFRPERQSQHAEGYFDVRMAAASRGAGVADGVANRVDRVAAIGNAQVPSVARLAWETLTRARLA